MRSDLRNLLLCGVLVGCESIEVVPIDAGSATVTLDASSDAGVDAKLDARPDAEDAQGTPDAHPGRPEGGPLDSDAGDTGAHDGAAID